MNKHFDWETARNLANDVICDGVRVSTGLIRTHPMYAHGGMTYIETYIFSDVPALRTQQICHNYRDHERSMKAHANIVKCVCEHLGIGVDRR